MNELNNIDFGCKLHKRCKQFMLDSRNYELGRCEKNLKYLFEDIAIIKSELFSLPYEILVKRKDLLFYLHNSRTRTTIEELWKEIDICYRVVKSATDTTKHGVF